jgi:glycosyltransferase involved in cell wall biosynthesis
MISFLVICYNHEKYIERAITSIFSQKLSCDFEVLIHDDGSEDSTIKILESLGEKYKDKIRVFVTPREKEKKIYPIDRISAAFSVLLRQMKGKYFCLLDGDDYYISQAFAIHAINIMEKDESISSVVFDFEFRLKNRVDSITSLAGFGFNEGIIDSKRFLYSVYVHSGAFVFKNYFNDRQREKLISTSFIIDNVIVPFILQFGRLYYIKELVYSYTYSQGLWSSMPLEEQNVFSAILVDVVAHVAPVYKWELLYRFFPYIKYLQRYKKKINVNNVNWYINKLHCSSIGFYLRNILNWNNIHFFKKAVTTLMYFYMKVILLKFCISKVCTKIKKIKLKYFDIYSFWC